MKEIFKEIKGYEKYQVSNFGRIKNKKGVILKNQIGDKGYLHVTLSNSFNKRKSKRIHRIVAENFIEKIEGKNIVNHKNGIKTDNCVKNLEWCNHLENNIHAYKIGLKDTKKQGLLGGKHYKSKKVLQYDLNGNFIKKWYSLMDIEREIGINHRQISRYCSGKYLHNKYIFIYD